MRRSKIMNCFGIFLGKIQSKTLENMELCFKRFIDGLRCILHDLWLVLNGFKRFWTIPAITKTDLI